MHKHSSNKGGDQSSWASQSSLMDVTKSSMSCTKWRKRSKGGHGGGEVAFLKLKSLRVEIVVSNNDNSQSSIDFWQKSLFANLFVYDSQRASNTSLNKLVATFGRAMGYQSVTVLLFAIEKMYALAFETLLYLGTTLTPYSPSPHVYFQVLFSNCGDSTTMAPCSSPSDLDWITV